MAAGMVKDENFDLLLHEDGKLEELVGGTITERVTIHHWPLSHIQRLTLANGQKYIYKAQAGPTVEGKFYATAESALLVPARILYDSDGYLCMLLNFIEAPSLTQLKLSEEQTLSVACDLSREIASIKGDLPALQDLRGPGKWTTFVRETVGMLDRLVREGRFKSSLGQAIRRTESLAKSTPALAAVSGPTGYLHGDFKGDNILKLPDGYKVIDWTRPLWGPADLDCLNAVASAGYSPLRHFERGLGMVHAFLSINWAAQCQLQWFKEGDYEKWVEEGCQRMDRCAEGEW